MLFTDSTIALNWIMKAEYMSNKTQTRSVFVNNRIDNLARLCREMHEVRFAHIGTQSNSADLATRIVSSKTVKKSSFLSGPKFLHEDLTMYECVTVPNPNVENDPELPKFFE